MKKFLKKNKYFVLLLALILCITGGLSIYTLQKKLPKKQGGSNAPVNEVKPEEDNKTAEITGLTANYDRKGKQIRVSWSYSEHKSKVERVDLYLNNVYVGNVSNMSYYNLPQNVYGFPTDQNNIKLVLTLEEEMTVEKETQVFVYHVLTAKQEVEQSEHSTKVTLQYEFNKDHPVEIPKILLTSGDVDMSKEVSYVGTEITENGTMVTARTTYEFHWSDTPVTYQSFGVRWIFVDEQDNFDFQAVKGVKP